MTDVFISYESSQPKLTERLAKDLEMVGFSVWWDTSLLPHHQFEDEIFRQLDAAKAVIVIWTAKSIASDWVREEANRARRQGKLINTRVAGIKPEQIPNPFNKTNVALVTDRAKIIAAVKQLAGRSWLPRFWRPAAFASVVIVGVLAALTFAGILQIPLIGTASVPGGGQPTGPTSIPRPAVDLTSGPMWTLEGNRTSYSFAGAPAVLKWTYAPAPTGGVDEGKPKAALRYELQSARDAQFSAPESKNETFDYKSVGGINGARFWRVRAVEHETGRALSGWSPTLQVAQYDNATRRIEETGKVTVYISDSTYQDLFRWEKDKEVKGFEPEFAQAIVAELRFRAGIAQPQTAFETLPFTDLLKAPSKGLADMVIAAVSKRPRREQENRISFSATYYCTTQALIYPISEPDRPIREMIAGKIVGYQKETTSKDLVVALAEGTKFEQKSWARTDEVIQALERGDVKFVVTDVPFAVAEMRKLAAKDDRRFKRKAFENDDFPSSFPRSARLDEYAIAVSRERPDLLADVNKAIEKSKEDGTLMRLLSRAAREYDAQHGIPLNAGADERLRGEPWVCPG